MRHQFLFVALFLSNLSLSFAQTYEPNRDSFFEATNYASNFLAVYDFNNDGIDDILVGGNNGNVTDKTPIYLLISGGDGTFTNQITDFVNGELVATNPSSINADYNQDGVLDFAIFDKGNLELGQDPVHTGFYGEDAQLLLSNPSGTWDISSVLAETHQAANHFGNSELHIKFGATADVDLDGDPDIYVEAGGGSQQLDAHLYINEGDNTFSVGKLEERLWVFPFKGPNFQWRQQACNFADVNNDGYPDLLVGQLRRTDNGQDDLTSYVLLNDGNGFFLEDGAIPLAHPDWHEGYTYTKSIMSLDLNQDGWVDLIYSQQRGQDDLSENDDAFSGNYMQVYINVDGKEFIDKTFDYMNLTEDILAVNSDIYGINSNSGVAKLYDMNEDGFEDIFITQGPPIDKNNPLIYFNNGSNYFSPASPEIYNSMTGGQQWFGEASFPIDLNGDGMLDIVSADLTAGTDGTYGTGDEYDEIFAIMGIRNYPKVSAISIPSNEALASGLNLTFVPELGITHFYIEKIHGGQLFTNDQEPIDAETLIERSVAESGFLFTPESGFQGNAYFYIQGATSNDKSDLVGSKFISKIEVTCSGPGRPEITINASSTSVCSGESITLSGTGGVSYNWDNDVIDGQSFTLQETTTFGVIGYDNAGCSNTSSITIEAKEIPEKPDITLVEDSKTRLISSGTTGNQWFLNGNEIDGASDPEYFPKEIGVYTVQVTLDECKSEFSNAIELDDIVLSALDGISQLKLWPNPVDKVLYFQDVEPNFTGFRIYRISGERVMIGQATNSIDVSLLTRGVYLIQFHAKSEIATFKFIKK
ncbi:MAG: FG-GAP-like repeat-containing protein [Cyclobacteriaceae bacterium]